MLTGGSPSEYYGIYSRKSILCIIFSLFICDVLITQWRFFCLLFCWEPKIDLFSGKWKREDKHWRKGREHFIHVIFHGQVCRAYCKWVTRDPQFIIVTPSTQPYSLMELPPDFRFPTVHHYTMPTYLVCFIACFVFSSWKCPESEALLCKIM